MVATVRGRVAAMPRGDLKGVIDVVDRGGYALRTDLVRSGRSGLHGLEVDVLDELEAAVAVWGLEHGDVLVVAV